MNSMASWHLVQGLRTTASTSESRGEPAACRSPLCHPSDPFTSSRIRSIVSVMRSSMLPRSREHLNLCFTPGHQTRLDLAAGMRPETELLCGLCEGAGIEHARNRTAPGSNRKVYPSDVRGTITPTCVAQRCHRPHFSSEETMSKHNVPASGTSRPRTSTGYPKPLTTALSPMPGQTSFDFEAAERQESVDLPATNS